MIRTYAGGGQVAAFDRGDKGPVYPMADNDPQRSTYRYAGTITLANNHLALVAISGAASRKVVLREVYVGGSCLNSPQNLPFQIMRVASLPTGGVAGSWAKCQTNDPAPLAGIQIYDNVVSGAISGSGGNGGVVGVGRINVAPPSNGAIDRLLNDYTWKNDRGLEINSGEFVALRLVGNNSNANAPLLDIQLMTTEEII